MFWGFSADDIDVEAPGKFHVHIVGDPVDEEVKFTQSFKQIVFSEAVTDAIGVS